MKTIKKVKAITKAYKNAVVHELGQLPENKTKQAVRNAQTCNSCKFLVKKPFPRCGVCGCPIKAKVHDKCPEGKF